MPNSNRGPARGILARAAGTCAVCSKSFPAGTRIMSTTTGGWGHSACVTAARGATRNKARIEAGETFAGHQQSGWRRGQSPSSNRPKR